MDEAEPFGTYAPTGLVRRAVETTRGLSDSWLARRCIIALRRMVMPLLRGRPVDIEALGARMRVMPYSNICEKRMLFAPQTFDPRELEILAGRLRDGFVFIDVGANVGSYSLFVAARAGPSARILAVEPQPGIFERLIHNIRLNAFANVKAVACAVADRDGEVTLFIDRRNSGASSVKIVGAETGETVRVPAKRLLTLLREERFERVDAIKLDIEGAEDIVLPAFFAEAPDELFPSLLIIENAFGRWQGDLPALLARHGYREVAQTRMNLVLARDEATTGGRPS